MKENVRESALTMIEEIVNNMNDFQTNFGEDENPYVDEIEEFQETSEEFIEETLHVKNKQEILSRVRDYVLKINSINDSSDYALIETDEREQIAGFIFTICAQLGYHFNYDITEEYREW